jgi:hypothetical protein
MITIGNNEKLITNTDYWNSEAAAFGYVYLSTNADAVRLLLPDLSGLNIHDIKQSKLVVISVGRHTDFNAFMAEVVFNEGSKSPYVIYVALNQFEKIPTEQDYMKKMDFILVTPADNNTQVKNELLCQCVFRKSKKLPDLTPLII